jgi:hypothetical protein
VWVALSEARFVKLSLWRDFVTTGPDTGMFIGPAPAYAAEAMTKQIGENLHIALVTITIPADGTPLQPGVIYSYNVTFGGSPAQTADLKSLGLLRNGEMNGKPHLCLGYDETVLPSLTLPPPNITDLRLLHGSCRRMTQTMDDGLAWVDDLIQEARTNPLARPHQLLLSGDQIYADDVPLPFLPLLIACSRELLGPREFLPTIWPQPLLDTGTVQATYWPADATHFPPGMRHRFIDAEARFTTVDKHSHVIAFGEFAAYYLLSWSNTLWDLSKLTPFDALINALQGPVATLFPNWGAIFRERNAQGTQEIPTDLLERFLNLLFDDLDVAERRAVLKPHEEGESTKPLQTAYLELELLKKDPPDAERFRTIYHFARTLLEEGPLEQRAPKLSHFRHFMASMQELFGGLYTRQHDKRTLQVEMFYNSLPKVRRALANVPTYMMFDDHDVTDDWYLNPMWRDQVLTTPLGRTLIRNALVAYALFQAWGNDPTQFSQGSAAQLLEEATRLFPSGQTTPPTQDNAAAQEIDRLLGLDGGDPPVTWHYAVPGTRHLLLALDNRTRRSFVSRVGPPGNVALQAMQEQIPPGPLPAGIEVLIVVAPLPVLGPPAFDEIIAPLAYRVFDTVAYCTHNRDVRSGMIGTNPDAIEAWAFDPPTLEALLQRLAGYRRVVLLSGDVHYGSSQALSYWRKDETEPARFAQFTSSGLRNVMPSYIQIVSQSLAIAQRIARSNVGAERLGWHTETPAPLSFPASAPPVPALRARLRQAPVLVAPQTLPEESSLVRAPDWEWRLKPIRDTRPEGERPEPARVAPLPAGLQPTTLDGYRYIAARHGAAMTQFRHTRQVLFTNNLGLVRFATRQEGATQVLDAIHMLYAVHARASNPHKADVYAVHVVPLSAPGEPRPSQAFTGGAV